MDASVLSLDMDETQGTSMPQAGISPSMVSGSPPQSGRSSPPMPTTPSSSQGPDSVELQIDYWPIVRPSVEGKEKSQAKDKDQGKNSIKSQFRSLQVQSNPLLACRMVLNLEFLGVEATAISIDRRDLQWTNTELFDQRKETKK